MDQEAEVYEDVVDRMSNITHFTSCRFFFSNTSPVIAIVTVIIRVGGAVRLGLEKAK